MNKIRFYSTHSLELREHIFINLLGLKNYAEQKYNCTLKKRAKHKELYISSIN